MKIGVPIIFFSVFENEKLLKKEGNRIKMK